jgi:hypothetical protein
VSLPSTTLLLDAFPAMDVAINPPAILTSVPSNVKLADPETILLEFL